MIMWPTSFLTGFFLLLALYCGLDPFNQSAISDFPDFISHEIEVPSWSEIPNQKDIHNMLQKSEIKFKNQVQGPESIAFDPLGRGPYTGVADGRILFWDGAKWTDFAFTSANRSGLCDPKPSLLSYLNNEHICGRPLGLRFDKKTGDLYIADAYLGLMKVGPEGGLAVSLTTDAEGVPLGFTNDLDIDDHGNIYFTDSSTKYQRRNFLQLVFSGDDSGRLLKYDPVTKLTTILRKNLQFPNGVSMSKDFSFFVYCEGAIGRLSRYWLKGEKAGTSEVFAILPGHPDNVRTNEKGEFWVALHCRRNLFSSIMAQYTNLRDFVLRLPIPAKYQYIIHIGGRQIGVIMKYTPEGELVQILEDSQGLVVRAVSEVEEKDGKIWMGSVLMDFISVYDLDAGGPGAGTTFFSTGDGPTSFRFSSRSPDDIFAEFFGFSSPFGAGGGGGGAGGMRGSRFPSSIFGDDIFSSFAEGGGGATSMNHGAMRKAQPIENKLPCTLEELYKGTTKKMKISREIADVSGKTMPVQEVLTIDIKPGWKKGTKITFPEKGNEQPGITPADLVFIIDEKPHKVFTRDGNDLVFTQTISLAEALAGCTVHLTTLDGRSLTVPINGVINPNYEEVVRGEGMPIPKDPTKKGNLRIKFDIKFPYRLTAEQKAGIKRLLGA